MGVEVRSPFCGLAEPIGAVPDPVFSQSMVGAGVALSPVPGPVVVVAPLAGVVTALSAHAFVVSSGRTSVLVHLGIDTVRLGGEGFTAHVGRGDVVGLGQPVIGWSARAVEERGCCSWCPVIALETEADELGDVREDGEVVAGDVLFVVHG